MTRRNRLLAGAGAGLVALLVFLGVAELVAVGTGPTSAPTIAIGQNTINHTPQWLKAFAIDTFGESDKTALLAGIYAVLAILAAAAGAAAVTRRTAALVAIAVLGAVAAISAVTQPGSGSLAVAPSVVGAVVAMWVFARLVPQPQVGEPDAGPAAPETLTRRRLLLSGGALAVLGAAAYAGGRTALQSAYSAVASRKRVRLPQPVRSDATPAAPTGFGVTGQSSYITASDRFYQVNTELVVPQIDVGSYRLRLHGMVDHPRSFTYDQLLAMPMVEHAVTLACVSNPVGGPYIGNARWLGVPLKPILDAAGVHPGASQLFMTSHDGMTIGADLQAATDGRDALLAVGMNGEPLPFEHGYPVRVVIPGLYGYVSACKWVVDLEVTTYEAKQAYWVSRGYAAQAPVKLEARIDTPQDGATLSAGPVTVAGVAWRQHVGVKAVEVSVDGGPWQPAELAAVDSPDTWRLWRFRWHATAGRHRLQIRATDSNGEVQTAAVANEFPNGASGREAVVVTVA